MLAKQYSYKMEGNGQVKRYNGRWKAINLTLGSISAVLYKNGLNEGELPTQMYRIKV